MNKYNMKWLMSLLLMLPILLLGQEAKVIEGLPSDLNTEKLIFLQHEPMKVGTEEENQKTKEYVIQRQENHNRVAKEFNTELAIALNESYPFDYEIAFPSTYDSLLTAGAKYVLFSNNYTYDYLRNQPAEDELLVFGFFIKDQGSTTIYTLFELDEMKVYDAKMIVKKLMKQVKNQYPEAYKD